MAAARSIEIHILSRSYKVACTAEQEAPLLMAADYLDKKMREIRDESRVIGAERIAIMAGLNMAHDLLTKGGRSQEADARERLKRCNNLLDAALEKQDNLF